jgi:hypothetical protein
MVFIWYIYGIYVVYKDEPGTNLGRTLDKPWTSLRPVPFRLRKEPVLLGMRNQE